MKKRRKKKRLKVFFNECIDYLKDEWKFLLFCVVLTCILLFPLNYYITTGGGISNIDKRVYVEDAYKSQGTFNISYVTQLKGDVLTYCLSYIMPNWEREKYDDYKISDDDEIKDVEFRSKLDLDYSSSNAIYWGFKLAGEDVQLLSSKIYVIYVYKEYNSQFKVQDELISIDGYEYDNLSDIKKYINSLHEGDYVTVKVLRKGKEVIFKSKIHKNKDNNELLLGIGLYVIKDYKTEKDVKLSFKHNESGPSGGLITTLDIYNKLIKKDITNGLKVAGTGTIESDGSIGEIGGVKFKLLGAAKDKADLFLVPNGNYKEALKVAKDNNLKIKIKSVGNIEEAINYLSK